MWRCLITVSALVLEPRMLLFVMFRVEAPRAPPTALTPPPPVDWLASGLPLCSVLPVRFSVPPPVPPAM
jgi:hypothetical protein